MEWKKFDKKKKKKPKETKQTETPKIKKRKESVRYLKSRFAQVIWRFLEYKCPKPTI